MVPIRLKWSLNIRVTRGEVCLAVSPLPVLHKLSRSFVTSGALSRFGDLSGRVIFEHLYVAAVAVAVECLLVGQVDDGRARLVFDRRDLGHQFRCRVGTGVAIPA